MDTFWFPVLYPLCVYVCACVPPRFILTFTPTSPMAKNSLKSSVIRPISSPVESNLASTTTRPKAK